MEGGRKIAKALRRLACKSIKTDRQTEQHNRRTAPASYSGGEFSGTVDHLRPEEDLAAIERSREDERDGGRGESGVARLA